MTEFIEHALSQPLNKVETSLRKRFDPETPLIRRGRLIRIILDLVEIMVDLDQEQESMVVLKIGDNPILGYGSVFDLALGPPQELEAGSKLELIRYEPSIVNQAAPRRVFKPRPYIGRDGTLISVPTLGHTLVDNGTLSIEQRPKPDDSSESV